MKVLHTNDGFGDGTFMLHQGIQRRVMMTISHESGAELEWDKVQEIVIGEFEAELYK